MMDLAQFHGMFFDECNELLARADRHLAACAGQTGSDALRDLKRTAHSIKGGARTFGFNDLAELADGLEAKLEAMRLEGVDLGGLRLCTRAFDLIKVVVSAERDGKPRLHAEVESMLVELGRGQDGRDMRGAPVRSSDGDGGVGAADPSARHYRVAFRRAKTLVGAEWVVVDMLDTLRGMAEVRVTARPAPDDSDGAWRLELRSAEDEAALINVLGRVADPDSLLLRREDRESEGEFKEVSEQAPVTDRAHDTADFDKASAWGQAPEPGPGLTTSLAVQISDGNVPSRRQCGEDEAPSSGERDHVLIRVASRRYAVSADDVVAVRHEDVVHATAGLPEKVRGLVLIEGRLAPSVDLHDWFDSTAARRERFAPLLVVMLGRGPVGVRVDDVEDFISVPVGAVQVPELLADLMEGIVSSGWLLHRGQALTVLDLKAMLDPLFRGRFSTAWSGS